MWYLAVLAALCSYLLGNLNGAVIVSSIYAKDDVRSHGSGNAGLTNFIRTYGSKIAIYVILIDVGKAAVACFASGMLLNGYGYYTEGVALGALFVIIGHAFPALLGFKGGKGILSGVTVACMMDWRLGLFVSGGLSAHRLCLSGQRAVRRFFRFPLRLGTSGCRMVPHCGGSVPQRAGGLDAPGQHRPVGKGAGAKDQPPEERKI